MLVQVIQRKSQDESQRIWDNVNELQEEMNITKRNIEDIYDKDILRLQNLQNSLNGDVRKLKFDLNTALEDHQGLGGGKRSSLGVSENLENLVLEVQEEVRQLKKRGMNNHGLSDSFRNELNSITIDIDELNKEKQANAIEIEQLKRHISKLEVEKIEENESQISAFGKKIEQLEASAGRTSQRMRRMGKSSGDSEKVDLLLKEVQTVKNQVGDDISKILADQMLSQVYFMQQGILQIRAQADLYQQQQQQEQVAIEVAGQVCTLIDNINLTIFIINGIS